jgi:hypothetical protein
MRQLWAAYASVNMSAWPQIYGNPVWFLIRQPGIIVQDVLSGFSSFAFCVLHTASERQDAHAVARMLHTVARMPMDTQESPPLERVAKAVIVYITVLLVVAMLLTLFLAVVVFLLLVTGVATPWPSLPPSY